MAERRDGGRTDTLVKLLMILFISLFSFSVGTFFGKKTTESTLRKAALESEAMNEDGADRDTASIPPGSLDVKPEDALTEEELNKLSEEHAQAEKVSEKEDVAVEHTGKKSVEKKTAEKEHVKDAAAAKHESREKVATHESDKKVPESFKRVQAAAERVAKGQEPTASEASATTGSKARTPSSLPSQIASSSIGKFTVQVSSHQVESEAAKRAEELKTKGFSAFYVKADVNGKTWYRVSVGLFTTRKEANDYVATLKHDAQVPAAIVQKIVE